MLPTGERLWEAAGRSRALAERWRAGPAHRHATAMFDAVADERAGRIADAAEVLLSDDGWIAELFAPLVAALADDPWLEPPIRGHRDGLRSGAVLFEHPVASLTASVLSARVLAGLPPPPTIVVPGRLSVTRYVRAGDARLQRWWVPALPAAYTAATMGWSIPYGIQLLRDGQMVRQDGRIAAQLLSGATRDVVTLTATVRTDAAPVMREYDRVSGAFVRMATTDEGAARAQLLLTLLRVADADGAGPCYDAATRDGAFFLRWAAMREWLAHDWRAAWPRLRELATADPHPEVRATATATLDLLTAKLAA